MTALSMHPSGHHARTPRGTERLPGRRAIAVLASLLMFAALSELADGYNDPTVTWLYRHHPDQTHRMTKWRTWSTVGRRIALQRAAAVRSSGLWLPGGTRDQVEHEAVDVGPLQPKRVFPNR